MGREPAGTPHPDARPDTGPVAALQALVRIPTVSWPDETAIDTTAFEAIHRELTTRFPRLHARLEAHRVGVHGLLFRWPGTDDARPVVLMAHQDVAPVDESAPWQHPPFGAELHDGAIWGRGTLDDKASLIGICAAV